MSGNRSVAAAQRRRAGGPEPAAPGTNRGPQPSINSSQMFSSQQQGQQQQQQQQIRPGTSGRLAGQHAQLQQQQMQQQQQQTRDTPQSTGDAGVSKITIAQAITLITLRLGKAEMQLYELGHQVASTGGEQGFSSGIEGAENMVLIDKNLIDSIMSRLESLEKRAPTAGLNTGSGSSAEVTLLKQQFEAIKPSIAQNAKTTTALTKEQKDHKQQVDALKTELAETKELMNALQTLSMDNSTKIFALMSGEVNFDDGEGSDDLNGDEFDGKLEGEDLESEELEIVGTDLKDLIEQELNA